MKDPIERRRVGILNLTLLGVFLLFTMSGYIAVGLDFAKAILIGCLVVAINFFVSQRLLGKVLQKGKIPAALLTLYLGKLGISAVIIYYAIKYRMNPWGLMLGLSSIFLAVIFSSLMRGEAVSEKQ